MFERLSALKNVQHCSETFLSLTTLCILLGAMHAESSERLKEVVGTILREASLREDERRLIQFFLNRTISGEPASSEDVMKEMYPEQIGGPTEDRFRRARSLTFRLKKRLKEYYGDPPRFPQIIISAHPWQLKVQEASPEIPVMRRIRPGEFA